jgi:hypothetical protein
MHISHMNETLEGEVQVALSQRPEFLRQETRQDHSAVSYCLDQMGMTKLQITFK